MPQTTKKERSISAELIMNIVEEAQLKLLEELRKTLQTRKKGNSVVTVWKNMTFS